MKRQVSDEVLKSLTDAADFINDFDDAITNADAVSLNRAAIALRQCNHAVAQAHTRLDACRAMLEQEIETLLTGPDPPQ